MKLAGTQQQNQKKNNKNRTNMNKNANNKNENENNNTGIMDPIITAVKQRHPEHLADVSMANEMDADLIEDEATFQVDMAVDSNIIPDADSMNLTTINLNEPLNHRKKTTTMHTLPTMTIKPISTTNGMAIETKLVVASLISS